MRDFGFEEGNVIGEGGGSEIAVQQQQHKRKFDEFPSQGAGLKKIVPVEARKNARCGSCNWCKKQTVLLDFSSVFDGKEIYCAGLCSEKCFTEAARKIISVESGSCKPRYVNTTTGASGATNRGGKVVPLDAHEVLAFQRGGSMKPKSEDGNGTHHSWGSNKKFDPDTYKKGTNDFSSEIRVSSMQGSPNKSRSLDIPFQPTRVQDEWPYRNNFVELFVNPACRCGPFLDREKVKQIRQSYKGSFETVLRNLLEDVIVCALRSKIVLDFLRYALGNARREGPGYENLFYSINSTAKFWHLVDELSYNLKCCINFFSSSENVKCECLTSSSSSPNVESCRSNGSLTTGLYSTRHHNSNDFEYTKTTGTNAQNSDAQRSFYDNGSEPNRKYVDPGHFLDNQGTGEEESLKQHQQVLEDSHFGNIYSRGNSPNEFGSKRPFDEIENESETDFVNVEEEEEKDSLEVASQPFEKRSRLEENRVSGVEIFSAPKCWSIEQVTSFVEQTDLKDSIDKFRDNEIDGKALLLLKRDLVLNHMGFKLGPAIKLIEIIDELRTVQKNFF